jgi:hypothetical protein
MNGGFIIREYQPTAGCGKVGVASNREEAE